MDAQVYRVEPSRWKSHSRSVSSESFHMFPGWWDLKASESTAEIVLKTHLAAFSWGRCVLQLALLNARLLSIGLSR